VPALFRELHTLVPSCDNVFFWAGQDGALANMYCEAPELIEVLPLYLSEFHNKREREVLQTFDEVMRLNDEPTVHNFYDRYLKVSRQEYLKHDLHNLIMRPAGYHQRLHVRVREHDRSLGFLHSIRAERDPEFTPGEARILEFVAPFIAHALTEAKPSDVLTDSDDRGLIVATRQGKIEYLSPHARRLLLMVTEPEWSSKADWRQAQRSVLPSEVAALCQNLAHVFQGRVPSNAPVWRHQNAWGGFTFRAYWLQPDEALRSSALVGVTVERLEPLTLRLLRQLDRLHLSRREGDFCLLAVSGHSIAAIANRMGISINTAIAHRRSIYSKLDVHTGRELLEKLRSP
jgi:DNA-binding CsgD family transcriptional regulator